MEDLAGAEEEGIDSFICALGKIGQSTAEED